MRNIWFFGDSTTYGHGLRPGFDYYEDYPNSRGIRWTQYLSKYFNGKEVNKASCGASNMDIQYELITNLSNIKSNDVVIIQSTYPTRISVHNKYGDLKPIHIALNDEIIEGFTKEQVSSFKLFSKNFLIDYFQNYDDRDTSIFLSLKRELELRDVTVIFWYHEVMNTNILKKFGWKTIKEESTNRVNDFHLGWEAQKKFFEFIKGEYESGNSTIYPNPEFYTDIEKLSFNYNIED